MNKRIIIGSIIIFLFALYINVVSFHEVVPLKKTLDDFPLTWKGWEGNKNFFDADILDKLRADEYMSREYVKGTDRINLYVGYYGSQKAGAQIHSPKHCLPGSGWFKLYEKDKILDIENTGKINYIEALYQKDSEKALFIYWYKMKDVYVTNDYILKLYMIINSLKYRRNDAAFLRFSTPVVKDVEDAENVIESAMRDLLPLLKDYLPE
jgi:EpsI family protein